MYLDISENNANIPPGLLQLLSQTSDNDFSQNFVSSGCNITGFITKVLKFLLYGIIIILILQCLGLVKFRFFNKQEAFENNNIENFYPDNNDINEDYINYDENEFDNEIDNNEFNLN